MLEIILHLANNPPRRLVSMISTRWVYILLKIPGWQHWGSQILPEVTDSKAVVLLMLKLGWRGFVHWVGCPWAREMVGDEGYCSHSYSFVVIFPLKMLDCKLNP
jgi:hypothetical protein